MPTYKFNVAMTCGGCSSRVEKILSKKLGDAGSWVIDLENKLVSVTCEGHSEDDIMAMIAKCGKETTKVVE